MFILASAVSAITFVNQLWYISAVNGTVVQKESVGQDNAEYVVKILTSEVTGATRVLSIKNQWYLLKFDKDEIYNSIKVNASYRFFILGKDNNIKFCD